MAVTTVRPDATASGSGSFTFSTQILQLKVLIQTILTPITAGSQLTQFFRFMSLEFWEITM